jgi:hypothetical protein
MLFTNNVYGPYSQQEWDLMLMTKRSISWMRNADPARYSEAIRKERAILSEDFYSRIAS